MPLLRDWRRVRCEKGTRFQSLCLRTTTSGERLLRQRAEAVCSVFVATSSDLSQAL